MTDIAQHLLGERLDARQACPECPIGGLGPAPFCLVCLGAGLITTDRLARWQAQQNAIL